MGVAARVYRHLFDALAYPLANTNPGCRRIAGLRVFGLARLERAALCADRCTSWSQEGWLMEPWFVRHRFVGASVIAPDW